MNNKPIFKNYPFYPKIQIPKLDSKIIFKNKIPWKYTFNNNSSINNKNELNLLDSKIKQKLNLI